MALTITVLAPWLARGIIQSGYLLYPVSAIDIFEVKWKIPPAMAQNDAEWITSWSRIPGQSKDVVLEMPLESWLPVWYSWHNTIERQLYYGIVFAIPLLLISAVVKVRRTKANLKEFTRYAFLYATVFAGVAFWFFNAPAFRLGIGFTGALFVLLFSPLLKWLLQSVKSIQRPLVVLLFASYFLYQGVMVYKFKDLSQLTQRLVYPVDYPQPEVKEQSLEQLVVYLPTAGDQCWYTPLPCTPGLRRGIGLLGEDVEAGFFISPGP